MATQTALSALEERLRRNSESLVFSRLADLYRKAGNIDQAIELCTKGLEKHPTYVTGRLILGRCYLEREDLAQAAEAFLNVCKIDKRNIVAIKMLADIFMRQGFPEKAGDLYAIAANMDPYNEALSKMVPQGRRTGFGKNNLFELLGITATPKPAQTAAQTQAQTGGSQASGAGADTPFPDAPPAAEPVFEDAGKIMAEAATVDLPAGEALIETFSSGPSVEELTEAAAPDFTAEETLSGAVEVSGIDISDRMTELFGEGESATAAPPAPSAEQVTKTSDEAAEAHPLAEVPDGDTISSRIDELFGSEPANAPLTVNASAGIEKTSPPEPEVEELVPDSGQSLEETMILDIDEIKKMRVGIDIRDSEDTILEAKPPLIVDEGERDAPKAEDALELITDDATEASDIPFDTVTDDLIVDEKDTIDDLLSGIERPAVPLIYDKKEEEPIPEEAPIPPAVSPEAAISGEDVAERIEGLFTGNPARREEKSEPPSACAAFSTASQSYDEILFEKGEESLSSAQSQETMISGDDIVRRIEGLVSGNRVQPEEKPETAPEPPFNEAIFEKTAAPADTPIPASGEKTARGAANATVGSRENPPDITDQNAAELAPIFSGSDIEQRLDEFFAEPARTEVTIPPPSSFSEATVSDLGGSGQSEETIIVPEITEPAMPEEATALFSEATVSDLGGSGQSEETIIAPEISEPAMPGDVTALFSEATVADLGGSGQYEEIIIAPEISEPAMPGEIAPVFFDAPEAGASVSEPSADGGLLAGGEASGGEPESTEEETFFAHPLDEKDMGTGDASQPAVAGEDKKESTAVFEDFSPEIVPAAPPLPPEVPLFISEPGAPDDKGSETVVGNFDTNDKLYDIPDHVLTPTLADLYYQQGQPRLALSIYRRLLEKDDDNVKLRLRIEEIEKMIAAGNTAVEPPERQPEKEKEKEKKNVKRVAPASSSRQRPGAREDTRPLAGVRIKKKPKITWKKKGG